MNCPAGALTAAFGSPRALWRSSAGYLRVPADSDGGGNVSFFRKSAPGAAPTPR
jgi:hypothetical protein